MSSMQLCDSCIWSSVQLNPEVTSIFLLPCTGIVTSSDSLHLLLGCDVMPDTRSCLLFHLEVEFSREQEL